jgi:hypothetical protein
MQELRSQEAKKVHLHVNYFVAGFLNTLVITQGRAFRETFAKITEKHVIFRGFLKIKNEKVVFRLIANPTSSEKDRSAFECE